MDISQIIKKVFSEQVTTSGTNKPDPQGLNWEDKKQILTTVVNNCTDPTIQKFKGRPIRTLSKDQLKYFPGVTDPAFFQATKIGENVYVLFGQKDENTANKRTALLTYLIKRGQEPEKVDNGLGSRCQQLMSLNQYGVEPLNAENFAKLKAYQDSWGAINVKLEEPDAKDILLYDKINYNDLVDRSTGKKIFDPPVAEDGYVWLRTGLQQNIRNLAKSIEDMLPSQGFTTDETSFDLMADEGKYAFYLKDILGDWPALRQQGEDVIRPYDIIYPTEELMNPTKDACRAAIKKLDYCITSSKGADCGKDLFKNKITVLRCGDFKALTGSNFFGMKKEYENVMRTGKPYGVADLKRVIDRGAVRQGQIKKRESSPVSENLSIDKKINKVLNEQFKKFKF